MGPTFFFLVILSFIANWVINMTPLPLLYWICYILPSVLVFFLCDHQKVLEIISFIFFSILSVADSHSMSDKTVLSRLKTSHLRSVLRGARVRVALCSVLLLSIFIFFLLHIQPKIVIPLVAVFLLATAFSLEKTLFIGDEAGELSKSLLERAVRLVPFPMNKMNWKGPWAYCSPFSRCPVHKKIKHFYRLVGEDFEKKSQNTGSLKPFKFKFQIEKCYVVCKYDVIQRHRRTLEEHLVATRREDGQGVSFSESRGADAVTSSQNEIVSGRQVQQQVIDIKKVISTLYVQKGDERVATYTFFPDNDDAVVELKKVMKIWKSKGNVVYSGFHANVGSRVPKAHATCYEFEEIFDLILNKGYRLEKVNLCQEHLCSISGSTAESKSLLFFGVIAVGAATWMNFYQLKSTSVPHSILIFLVTLFCVLEILPFIWQIFLRCRKKILYLILRAFCGQERTDSIYLFFQRTLPRLTFCNESYGRPYAQESKVVCKFWDKETIRAEVERIESFPPVPTFKVGPETYVLRNILLTLEVRVQGLDLYVVHVCINLKGEERPLYNNYFGNTRDRRKVENLIGILEWLCDKQWQGICSSWPSERLIHAFTYRELVCKTLDMDCYYEPVKFFFKEEIKASVEGARVTVG